MMEAKERVLTEELRTGSTLKLHTAYSHHGVNRCLVFCIIAMRSDTEESPAHGSEGRGHCGGETLPRSRKCEHAQNTSWLDSSSNCIDGAGSSGFCRLGRTHPTCKTPKSHWDLAPNPLSEAGDTARTSKWVQRTAQYCSHTLTHHCLAAVLSVSDSQPPEFTRCWSKHVDEDVHQVLLNIR